MLRSDRFRCGLPRNRFRLSALTAAVAASTLLPLGTAAWAASPESNGPVSLQFTIPVPVAATNTTGGMYGFDISFVDQSNQTYYLGDRSNAAVDVVDASTGTFVKQITATPPFAGATGNNATSGPNGVATDGTGKCLFAGDGPSRVVSSRFPKANRSAACLRVAHFARTKWPTIQRTSCCW